MNSLSGGRRLLSNRLARGAASIAVAFCMSCALAGSQPPTPWRSFPAWPRAASIWVDPEAPHEFMTTAQTARVLDSVRSALPIAGFRVLTTPDKGALQFKLAQVGSLGLLGALRARSLEYECTVALEGKPVEAWRFYPDELGCGDENVFVCAGKMIVNRLIDSQPVAAAAASLPQLASQAVVSSPGAGQTPTATAAPPMNSLPVSRAAPAGKLAVLELRSLTPELTADNARYFTDLVRSAALRVAPQVEVMTRENLLVLLKSTGRDLSNCEGECEVDTGRRIGADSIISGELQKVGTRYKLSLRLHETAQGRLSGGTVASGRSIDELDDAVSKAVKELFTAAP